jgi:hypothetical protein
VRWRPSWTAFSFEGGPPAIALNDHRSIAASVWSFGDVGEVIEDEEIEAIEATDGGLEV